MGLRKMEHGNSPVVPSIVRQHYGDHAFLSSNANPFVVGAPCKILSSDGAVVIVQMDTSPMQCREDPQDSPVGGEHVTINISNPGVQLTFMPLEPGDVVINVTAPGDRGVVSIIYPEKPHLPVIEWKNPEKISKRDAVDRALVILWYNATTYNTEEARVGEVREFRYGGDNKDKIVFHGLFFEILEVRVEKPEEKRIALTRLVGEGMSQQMIDKFYPYGIPEKGIRMLCNGKHLHLPELVVGDAVSVFGEAGRGAGCVKVVISRCADRADAQYEVCFGPTEATSIFRRRQLMFSGKSASRTLAPV